jgi:hypothetical protein
MDWRSSQQTLGQWRRWLGRKHRAAQYGPRGPLRRGRRRYRRFRSVRRRHVAIVRVATTRAAGAIFRVLWALCLRQRQRDTRQLSATGTGACKSPGARTDVLPPIQLILLSRIDTAKKRHLSPHYKVIHPKNSAFGLQIKTPIRCKTIVMHTMHNVRHAGDGASAFLYLHCLQALLRRIQTQSKCEKLCVHA